MSESNTLVYFLRRDLRVSDNPILHHLATSLDHGFTHLLPVYVFPANQIEVSGFITDGGTSPYPEARTDLCQFWKCGRHRAKFIAEAVWEMKQSLEALGSGLVIRIGEYHDITTQLLDGLQGGHQVGAVWMAGERGVEEQQDEDAVLSACRERGVEFRRWDNEKELIHEADLPFDNIQSLPDVFRVYQSQMRPLRSRPRPALPRPPEGSLPAMVSLSSMPPQAAPFTAPNSYPDLQQYLLKPLLEDLPGFYSGALGCSFKGGERRAQDILRTFLRSGAICSYKENHDKLQGGTKLSAYLAHGCLTARQIHEQLLAYEDGTDEDYKEVAGCGMGVNVNTEQLRISLLRHDYADKCAQKFAGKLLLPDGFHGKAQQGEASTSFSAREAVRRKDLQTMGRFSLGKTGMGFVDAGLREACSTGCISNRAYQVVADFLVKHIGVDWRCGAELFGMWMVDCDVSHLISWQYSAGVGNDPKKERIFNPVHQGFKYDQHGDYVRRWVPEVRSLTLMANVLQPYTASEEELDNARLSGDVMVTSPLKKIEYCVQRKPRPIAGGVRVGRWGRRDPGRTAPEEEVQRDEVESKTEPTFAIEVPVRVIRRIKSFP